jgi:hypothetical protein
MRDVFFTILSTVLSVIVVGIGLQMAMYFIKGDGGVFPFLIGLIGFFIAINPAINQWEEVFRRLFKIKD